MKALRARSLGGCVSLAFNMRKINFLVWLLLCAAMTLGAQQLSTKKTLNLAVAKKIVAAAENEAMKNGWAMFVTVVDDGGTVIYLERLDDAQIGSLEVSIEKAQTALKFKRPTKAFEDLVTGGRNSILKLPGALPVEGGIPLMADGKVIGAIGASGGSSQQDAQVAQAASPLWRPS
jgi:glc operon protein GlcG